jgi:hypothetical protein
MGWFEDNFGKLLGIGASAGAGLLTKEAYDRLQTIGETAKTEATALASEIPAMAAFKPFTVTTGMGGQLGVDELGGAALSLGGAEGALAGTLLGEAGQRFGVGPVGAEQLAGAGQQLLGAGQAQVGAMPFGLSQQEAAAQQAFGLGGQFMGQAGMPMGAREQAVYDRIRATQLGEEERQRLALEERLFNQGRGGVQTAMFGGTPEQLALAKAQESSQNQAALMALTQAQQEQRQSADIGATYGQLGSNIATQRQALETAQQMQALQALTGGMGLLTGGMGLQQAQQQLGLGALGGAYVPQAQLLNAIQATSLFPQLQQQAQLFGTGQYGETMMTGIEAQLIAEQAAANLLGSIGSGILGGLFSPVATKSGGVGTGIGSLFGIG